MFIAGVGAEGDVQTAEGQQSSGERDVQAAGAGEFLRSSIGWSSRGRSLLWVLCLLQVSSLQMKLTAQTQMSSSLSEQLQATQTDLQDLGSQSESKADALRSLPQEVKVGSDALETRHL